MRKFRAPKSTSSNLKRALLRQVLFQAATIQFVLLGRLLKVIVFRRPETVPAQMRLSIVDQIKG